MKRIDTLRAVRTKPQLAKLLGFKPSTLTYLLYVLKPSTQYTNFTIPKKSGGVRIICAPSDRLKALQSSLSVLLQDCIEDINKAKKADGSFQSTLSHGFVRKRSIITNAMMHLNQKNVLNIDIKDFFDSFNFGRVRGFFITNKNFLLDPSIATVIAQIACNDDKLPQGSPCSPVISNLITHILDIRLAALAEKYSCTYSRYADDITFSTRERLFPPKLMREMVGEFTPGKQLKDEIRRSGFALNNQKTRIQRQCSRQDVTGLVVNKKPNIKSEYWRTVKSQCHALFKSGHFTKTLKGETIEGNIKELEGQLNFIDQIDYFNRLRDKPPLQPEYALKHGIKTSELLSSRERTFSRFLYYKSFYGNDKPTILCEGKTDNIYFKAAISRLAPLFPNLATPKTDKAPYELLVSFLNYSNRTRFLLELSGGATYIHAFVAKFDIHYKYYKAPKPNSPVIVIFDNDKAFGSTEALLKNKTGVKGYLGGKVKSNDLRSAEFIHVVENLYIVLTPRGAAGQHTEVEDLFTRETLDEVIDGKTFLSDKDADNTKHYGKEIFSKKVVTAKKSTLDFNGFIEILNRISQCIQHYDQTK